MQIMLYYVHHIFSIQLKKVRYMLRQLMKMFVYLVGNI